MQEYSIMGLVNAALNNEPTARPLSVRRRIEVNRGTQALRYMAIRNIRPNTLAL
jgi:hypothetical protein